MVLIETSMMELSFTLYPYQILFVVFFCCFCLFCLFCCVSAKKCVWTKIHQTETHFALKFKRELFCETELCRNLKSSITSNADYSSLMPLWKLLVRHYEFTHQRISIYIWTCLNKITTKSCRIRCYFLFYVEVFFGINVHNLYHVINCVINFHLNTAKE